MVCLLDAFGDGKVSAAEVDACKAKTYSTDLLNITYPKAPELHDCSVPRDYPATGTYKLKEYVPLPAVAKGKEPKACTGVMEISTTPAEGSPAACKCKRVTFNGPFSPGPIVKCEGCLDVRRSKEKNSCPDGTKIFSPRSRTDWQSFIKSADALSDPNFIVDVTNSGSGCGGCNNFPFNSIGEDQKMWKASDHSEWWLRGDAFADAA